MYSTISSDENILNPAYGVGFYFSIINSCLFCLLIPAVYLMVSSDGVIQDKPRPKSRQIRSMLFTAGEDKQPSMSTLSSVRSGSSRITPSQRTYGDTIRSERSITSESSNAVSDYSSRSKKTDRYQRLQDPGTSKPSKLVNSIEREERRIAPKELPAIPERTHTSKKPMHSALRIKTEYTDELEQTSRRNRSTDRTRSARGNGARNADDAKILSRKKSERRPLDGSRKPGRNPSDRSLKSAPESKRSMSGRAEIEMDDFASSTMSDFDDFLKSFDK